MSALLLCLQSRAVAQEEPASAEPPTSQTNPPPPAESAEIALNNFPELRTAILNQIGSANRRIWLATEYLTDGEICAALYLAQYRHINVQVLLGRKAANQYMSRLKYLKDQNIPVFLKPLNFSDKSKTTLLVDDKLLRVDADLNFMGKNPGYALKTDSDASQIQNFAQEFNKASTQKIQAVPKPVPLVGRPGLGGPVYQPHSPTPAATAPAVKHSVMPSLPNEPEMVHDVYNYDRSTSKHRQVPSGVARKLPRETIQQQSARKQRAVKQATSETNQANPVPQANPAPTDME